MVVDFDGLIAQMPAIAKAVNAFASPDVQQQAFAALLESLGAPIPLGSETAEHEDKTPKTTKRRAAKKAAPKKQASNGEKSPRRKSSSSPSLVRDLNLRPKGSQSFADFVAEKSPRTDQERLLAAVYWMQYVANMSGITVDHVYTCIKDAKWKVPANLSNALSLVSNRKGWINTSNGDDLTVAVSGENHIEHDMPKVKAAA